MSTDYTLITAKLEDKSERVLTVIKHSNLFDIYIFAGYEEPVIPDLTLDQLKQVRDKLSQVISCLED